jgi:hypothetical protein
MIRWFMAIGMLALSSFSAFAEKRVALVVGVGAYNIQNPLQSSKNDAQLVGNFLANRGFTMVGGGPLADLNKQQFDWAVEKFGELSQGADVAMFYYSGHGMQIGGTNYLFPTDSPLVNASNIPFRFINMNVVMGVLERSGARLKVVLLDACRTNPFVRDGKADMGGGLAEMRAPAGTIIGFATQPGNTASDGSPRGNSPYTAAVFDVAQHAGYDQFRVFNDAGFAVMRNSNGKQQPWMSASPIYPAFYFTPPAVNLNTVNSAPATPALTALMPAPSPQPAVVVPVNTASQASYGGVTLNYTQEANKLFQQLDYAGGRAILTQGIQADPRSAIARSYRGYAWFQDGLNKTNPHESLAMFRAGFEDLDAAIQIEPAYPNSYRHRGNMIVATWKALKKTNQRTNDILDKAVSDLQNAVRLDPTSMSSAYYLGEAYNLKGDYASAISWFNKALEINPKFVAPHAGICFAKRMTGDMLGAQSEAEYAAKRDSDQANRSCLTASAVDRYVPKF